MNTDDTASEREKTIQFEMKYCVHYKPRGGMGPVTYCALGIVPENNWGTCIDGHKCEVNPCGKWERRTRKMGEARADRFEKSMRQIEIVGPVVAAWRKKPPRGKAEIIECPACKGRLHLSQASSNGHVHGKCETSGCVSWME